MWIHFFETNIAINVYKPLVIRNIILERLIIALCNSGGIQISFTIFNSLVVGIESKAFKLKMFFGYVINI